MNTYNGWSNYGTWCVNLWFTSVEDLFLLSARLVSHVQHEAENCRQVFDHVWTVNEAQRFLLADRLKELVEGVNPLRKETSLHGDLLNSAFSKVSWHQIAVSLLAQ